MFIWSTFLLLYFSLVYGMIDHKIGNYNEYIYIFEVIDLQFKSAFKVSSGSMILAVQIFLASLRELTFSLKIHFIVT